MSPEEPDESAAVTPAEPDEGDGSALDKGAAAGAVVKAGDAGDVRGGTGTFVSRTREASVSVPVRGECKVWGFVAGGTASVSARRGFVLVGAVVGGAAENVGGWIGSGTGVSAGNSLAGTVVTCIGAAGWPIAQSGSTATLVLPCRKTTLVDPPSGRMPWSAPPSRSRARCPV